MTVSLTKSKNRESSKVFYTIRKPLISRVVSCVNQKEDPQEDPGSYFIIKDIFFFSGNKVTMKI